LATPDRRRIGLDMTTSDKHDPPPPAIPAATVVIYRHGQSGGPAEILMVERSHTMRFAGGAAVFPGGRIDPADRELAAKIGGDLDPDDAAGRVAAIRETLEETGLAIGIVGAISAAEAAEARVMLADHAALEPVLEKFGWTLVLDQLVPFARWWPRHHLARVFDTRFYLADLGTGAVELEVDATENHHLFWSSAQGALELADEGKIQVIFPTRRNLERLAQFDDFASCRAHAEATPLRTVTPWIEERDGQQWLTIPDDLGYPTTCEPMDSITRG
jgi:8-oxo-dGTP pyrophosphatase MutT (NUDIX family)